jgi:sensor c-di-GMP phosphodiesterase-like protein
MQVGRFLVRLVGWLLTPFIAWAASFIGALLGASIARGVESPRTGLIITLVCGAIAGLGTLGVVIHYLRRSPRLRHALHVTEDAIPDTSEFLPDASPPVEKQP